MPLVKGHFPSINPLDSILGQPRNAAQTNLPARSNVSYLGYVPVDTSAVLVSGSTTFVAVPVEAGDIFSTVTLEIGNTAASTPTHFTAALYSGVLTTAKLLGTQSTDSLTTAIPANTPLVVALGAAYEVQVADAPYGYIFVALGYTGTASPSAIGTTGSTKDQAYKASSIFVNKPLVCATQAVGAAGTAAATVTLASSTSQAAIPYVWLS
jgi:hypothetical protein